MIFNEIKMRNFRQFRNECTIEFSSDTNKHITLVIAKNGVGKTTLLQAFKFCFYGESPNYLRLPKADELLNNNIKLALKENQTEIISVEVKFTSNGIKYLAKREKKFEKRNGKIRAQGESIFKLFKNDILKGYTLVPDDIATETIIKLLPPGISHVFMFDGERMEKKITDSAYKNELSKSVTGLLGLDKLRHARDKIIGERRNSTSLVSRVEELITTTKTNEEKILKEYNELKKNLDDNYRKLISVNNRIEEYSGEISALKHEQKIINDNKLLISNRDFYDKQMRTVDNERKFLLKQSNELLFSTLYNKYLLKNRSKLLTFLDTATNTNNFYQALHIDTLNDIIKNKRCICGNNVNIGSTEWENINHLFQFALPNEYSSYINKIRAEMNKGIDYSIGESEIRVVKEKLMELNLQYISNKEEYNKCIEQIVDFEKVHNIEKIQEKIESKSKILGGYESQKNALMKEGSELKTNFDKKEKLVKEINSKEAFNERVRNAVEDLIKVRNLIDEDYQIQESKVRTYLSDYLNNAVKELLDDTYETVLEDDYSIRIFSDNMKKEVTESLSTGESVVVSLSFISSLLNTAKSSLDTSSVNDQFYGVVMDAALSNVDELRIKNLCNKMFKSLDQLIFLSFKRQLRDELFLGISDNVGKSYLMSKNKNGDVIIESTSMEELKQVIHTIEVGEEQ